LAPRLVVVFVRWGIAAVGAVALADAIVVAQLSAGSAATGDFLSSVTALTNILSVIVFLIAGADAWRRSPRTGRIDTNRRPRTALSRGSRERHVSRIALMRALNVATLVSMSVLFQSIYGPVVVADPAQLNLTSGVLHVVVPAVAIVDWYVFPAAWRADIRGVFLVLVFPCVWFVYTFVRGSLTGRYVYEFLDPAGPSGVQGAVAMTVLIISCFFLVGVAVFLTQRSRHLRPTSLI
jgi:hypothetical protein